MGRFSRLHPLIIGAMLGAIPAAMFIFAVAGEVAFNLSGGVIALIAPVSFMVFLVCSGMAAIGARIGRRRERLHKGN